MAITFTLEGQEYDFEILSDEGKKRLSLIQFTMEREEELLNMKALLQRAKNGYIENLKKEILTEKSGFLFEHD